MKKRKKKKEEGEKVISGKRKKLESEAWVTIKKYLKDNSESGKEIIELFVVKRIDDKDVNSLPTKELKKKKRLENKEKKAKEKELRKKDPKKYKEEKKKNKYLKEPELWLLYFVTRNPKTKQEDKPRIIEAKIEYKKISKKETDRVITVNPKIDFNKEWEWIKPLKDKEDEAKLKNEAANKKRRERAAKKAKKEKEKAKKKKDEKH